ncbi:MAG: carboxypeptidase-like regulatory domain-containing protein [Planctomycetaceae bacterium]
MTALLLALLLGPGSIRVAVEADDPAARGEVFCLAGGIVRQALPWPAPGGVVVFSGLPDGAYDLVARGPGLVSAVERGVRPSREGGSDVDVRLRAQLAYPLRVATQPGATAWVAGIAFPAGEALAPAGLSSLLVDHPERVSSGARYLRAGGPLALEVMLDHGLVVAGRVFLPDGTPADGALVEVFADGAGLSRRATTDAEGAYAIGGFLGDVVSIRVRARGCADALRRVPLFAGMERARLDVDLSPASAVLLTITDGTGRPVPDAAATLLPVWVEEALEDPRLRPHHTPERRQGGGTFRFARLTPGRAYRILATRSGGAVRSTAGFVAPRAGGVLRLPSLAVEDAAALVGEVVGARGPEAGVVVLCVTSGETSSCRTDRAGKFRFEGLPAGEAFVGVRDRDERGSRIILDPARTARCTLRLPEGRDAVLAGAVFCAGGKALEGVLVEAAGRRAVTGTDGRFRIEGMPLGRESVRALFLPGPGCRALLEEPHLPRVEEEARLGAEVRIELQRGGELRLRLDSGGAVVGPCSLEIAGTSGVSLVRRVPRGRTELSIPDLPWGRYVLEVSVPGYVGSAGMTLVVPAAGEGAQVVPLTPGRAASGKVLRRKVRSRPHAAPVVVEEPAGGAWVLFLGREGRWARRVSATEEDGSFFLRGLPPGPLLITAAGPGLPPVTVATDLTGGDARELLLVLQEPAAAEAVVADPDGRAVQGLLARLFREDDVPAADLVARARFLGAVGDDSDIDDFLASRLRTLPGGRVRAGFLAPGSYRFLFTARGFIQAEARVRALAAWSRAELEGTLPGVPFDVAPRVMLLPEATSR